LSGVVFILGFFVAFYVSVWESI